MKKMNLWVAVVVALAFQVSPTFAKDENPAIAKSDQLITKAEKDFEAGGLGLLRSLPKVLAR